MIDVARPSEAFEFAWDPTVPATLTMTAAGAGLSLLADLRGTPMGAPDAAIPDPVAALSRAVTLGMVAGWNPTRPAVFDLISMTPDPERGEVRWTATADNLPPGVARLLANLLIAREISDLRILAKPPAGVVQGPLYDIPYPAVPDAPMPFGVDYQPPERRQSNRAIEITLHAAPDDPSLHALYKALEAWTHLPMLGAYAPIGTRPADSTAFPDPATLIAPRVLRQTFDIVFIADEAAFAPLITLFASPPPGLPPVAHIEIR